MKGWLAEDSRTADRLLEALERLAAGEPTTVEERARLRFAATAARRRPDVVLFDFRCTYYLTDRGMWCPTAIESGAMLWILAAGVHFLPGEWVPLARDSRNNVAGRIGRALASLRATDADLADALAIRPGKGPGLHLEARDGWTHGRFVLSAHLPRLDVRAEGVPLVPRLCGPRPGRVLLA